MQLMMLAASNEDPGPQSLQQARSNCLASAQCEKVQLTKDGAQAIVKALNGHAGVVRPWRLRSYTEPQTL